MPPAQRPDGGAPARLPGCKQGGAAALRPAVPGLCKQGGTWTWTWTRAHPLERSRRFAAAATASLYSGSTPGWGCGLAARRPERGAQKHRGGAPRARASMFKERGKKAGTRRGLRGCRSGAAPALQGHTTRQHSQWAGPGTPPPPSCSLLCPLGFPLYCTTVQRQLPPSTPGSGACYLAPPSASRGWIRPGDAPQPGGPTPSHHQSSHLPTYQPTYPLTYPPTYPSIRCTRGMDEQHTPPPPPVALPQRPGPPPHPPTCVREEHQLVARPQHHCVAVGVERPVAQHAGHHGVAVQVPRGAKGAALEPLGQLLNLGLGSSGGRHSVPRTAGTAAKGAGPPRERGRGGGGWGESEGVRLGRQARLGAGWRKAMRTCTGT